MINELRFILRALIVVALFLGTSSVVHAEPTQYFDAAPNGPIMIDEQGNHYFYENSFLDEIVGYYTSYIASAVNSFTAHLAIVTVSVLMVFDGYSFDDRLFRFQDTSTYAQSMAALGFQLYHVGLGLTFGHSYDLLKKLYEVLNIRPSEANTHHQYIIHTHHQYSPLLIHRVFDQSKYQLFYRLSPLNMVKNLTSSRQIGMHYSYWRLNRILRERNIYIELHAGEGNPLLEDFEDLDENYERFLRMDIYSLQDNGESLTRNVYFRSSTHFHWLETVLFEYEMQQRYGVYNGHQSSTSDINFMLSEYEFESALSPEWISHITNWLEDSENWTQYIVNADIDKQLYYGPRQKYSVPCAINTPDCFSRRIDLSLEEKGCLYLELHGSRYYLPKQITDPKEASSGYCHGVLMEPNDRLVTAKHASYNRAEAKRYVYGDQAVKTLFSMAYSYSIKILAQQATTYQQFDKDAPIPMPAPDLKEPADPYVSLAELVPDKSLASDSVSLLREEFVDLKVPSSYVTEPEFTFGHEEKDDIRGSTPTDFSRSESMASDGSFTELLTQHIDDLDKESDDRPLSTSGSDSLNRENEHKPPSPEPFSTEDLRASPELAGLNEVRVLTKENSLERSDSEILSPSVSVTAIESEEALRPLSRMRDDFSDSGSETEMPELPLGGTTGSTSSGDEGRISPFDEPAADLSVGSDVVTRDEATHYSRNPTPEPISPTVDEKVVAPSPEHRESQNYGSVPSLSLLSQQVVSEHSLESTVPPITVDEPSAERPESVHSQATKSPEPTDDEINESRSSGAGSPESIRVEPETEVLLETVAESDNSRQSSPESLLPEGPVDLFSEETRGSPEPEGKRLTVGDQFSGIEHSTVPEVPLPDSPPAEKLVAQLVRVKSGDESGDSKDILQTEQVEDDEVSPLPFSPTIGLRRDRSSLSSEFSGSEGDLYPIDFDLDEDDESVGDDISLRSAPTPAEFEQKEIKIKIRYKKTKNSFKPTKSTTNVKEFKRQARHNVAIGAVASKLVMLEVDGARDMPEWEEMKAHIQREVKTYKLPELGELQMDSVRINYLKAIQMYKATEDASLVFAARMFALRQAAWVKAMERFNADKDLLVNAGLDKGSFQQMMARRLVAHVLSMTELDQEPMQDHVRFVGFSVRSMPLFDDGQIERIMSFRESELRQAYEKETGKDPVLDDYAFNMIALGSWHESENMIRKDSNEITRKLVRNRLRAETGSIRTIEVDWSDRKADLERQLEIEMERLMTDNETRLREMQLEMERLNQKWEGVMGPQENLIDDDLVVYLKPKTDAVKTIHEIHDQRQTGDFIAVESTVDNDAKIFRHFLKEAYEELTAQFAINNNVFELEELDVEEAAKLFRAYKFNYDREITEAKGSVATEKRIKEVKRLLNAWRNPEGVEPVTVFTDSGLFTDDELEVVKEFYHPSQAPMDDVDGDEIADVVVRNVKKRPSVMSKLHQSLLKVTQKHRASMPQLFDYEEEQTLEMVKAEHLRVNFRLAQNAQDMRLTGGSNTIPRQGINRKSFKKYRSVIIEQSPLVDFGSPELNGIVNRIQLGLITWQGAVESAMRSAFRNMILEPSAPEIVWAPIPRFSGNEVVAKLPFDSDGWSSLDIGIAKRLMVMLKAEAPKNKAGQRRLQSVRTLFLGLMVKNTVKQNVANQFILPLVKKSIITDIPQDGVIALVGEAKETEWAQWYHEVLDRVYEEEYQYLVDILRRMKESIKKDHPEAVVSPHFGQQPIERIKLIGQQGRYTASKGSLVLTRIESVLFTIEEVLPWMQEAEALTNEYGKWATRDIGSSGKQTLDPVKYDYFSQQAKELLVRLATLSAQYNKIPVNKWEDVSKFMETLKNIVTKEQKNAATLRDLQRKAEILEADD